MTEREALQPSTPLQKKVLLVAIVASFIAILDGFVVNLALPAIGRELGGGLVIQQWVVDAYLLTLGALILVAGSLSDHFGRARILQWGLAGFALTSVMCGLAWNGEVLVVSRALQGIAGALLVPSSLAMIVTSFSGPAQSKAIGQWSGWTSAAAIVAPLIGGVSVDLLSWRLIFFINVVPAAAIWPMLAGLRASDAARDKSKRIDRQDALAKLGKKGPVKDERIKLETTYTFEPGIITRTDTYTPSAPLQVTRASLEFASWSDAPALQGKTVRFGQGDVSAFEVSGLDACTVEATHGADPYRAPEGPMASHVSCASTGFRFERPLTIKWPLRYR